MAIQCPHCGTLLPRDDARFCNNCGTTVPVQPSLQQISLEATPDHAASLQDASSTPAPKEHKSAPREQIAQQPFSRPSQFSAPGEPPSWIKSLETVTPFEKRSPDVASPSLSGLPGSPVFSLPPETPLPQDGTSQEDASSSMSPSRAQFAGRELHVKVWGQDDDTLLQPPPGNDPSSSSPDVIEELPTRPTLSAISPEFQDAASSPAPLPQNQTREQLELLDTVQIATYGQAQPIPATPLPSADQDLQTIKVSPAQKDFAPNPANSAPAAFPTQRPLPTSAYTPFLGLDGGPAAPPMPERLPVQSATPSSSPMQQPQLAAQPAAAPLSTPTLQPRKSRYPLLILLVLVPVVLVSALGVWIVQAHPFTVPSVSQPWQQFQDQSLGVSLLYPTGWQVQVDHTKSVVHFHDSSNTAQVNVSVTPATSSDLAQFLSQQAKQLQVNNAKSPTAVTFAHTSWMQIQGTTQESGADYTATLLAAVHNNHVFTITLLAPSNNYADQEKVNFSYIRNSWQFL